MFDFLVVSYLRFELKTLLNKYKLENFKHNTKNI